MTDNIIPRDIMATRVLTNIWASYNLWSIYNNNIYPDWYNLKKFKFHFSFDNASHAI